jgi:hypothetical protein
MELVAGKNLLQELAGRPDPDAALPLDELIAVGRATADALAHLHQAGIVFRDFAPTNIMHTPDGGYRLIDLGSAFRMGDDTGPPFGVGTAPFYSIQQLDGEQPDYTDDVFAWGAVLHYLGSDRRWVWPLARDGERWRQPFRRQPLRSLNPSVAEGIAAVIDRAVAWERSDRYRSMIEARAAFEEAVACLPAATSPVTVLPARDSDDMAPGRTESEEDNLAIAKTVGDALCQAAEACDAGVRWGTPNEFTQGTRYPPDLYDGAAGIALFLAALARATLEARYEEVARDAARWLSGPEWERGRALTGLHHGEAGIGYFYLRLAGLLDEPGYIHAAELRARRMIGVQFQTLDLFNGAAGAVYFLTALARETGEPSYLHQAREAADVLVEAARTPPNKAPGYFWHIPHPGALGRTVPFLGLLHGAAGIGLALSALAELTGDDKYHETALGAADFLLSQAQTGPNGAWRWPRFVGDQEAVLQSHCHGAGGIGQFFLRLARQDGDPRYAEAAREAAKTIASEERSSTDLCHGIAADAAFFLDMYQALGHAEDLERARRAALQLSRFRDAEREGVYYTKLQGPISPGLMTGYAGIGALHLRLARPESEPDLLLPPLA